MPSAPKPRFDLPQFFHGEDAKDWTSIASLPEWDLFWQSDAVQRVIAAHVKGCCEDGGTWEAVHYHRGALDTIHKLEHLPEAELKRRAPAPVIPGGEPVNVTWRNRLTNAWRALRAERAQ